MAASFNKTNVSRRRRNMDHDKNAINHEIKSVDSEELKKLVNDLQEGQVLSITFREEKSEHE